MGLRRSDSKHHQECCAEMSHDRSLDSAIRSPSAFPPKNPKQYCKSVVNQPPTWAESLSPTEKRLGASGGNVERARYTAFVEVRRDSAVKLVDVLAGVSPAGANCPVGTVVISGDGAGDQTFGSPEVKALDGWIQIWSAPTGGQAKQQVVAQANRG